MAVQPQLRGKAIAVCGDPAERRGIVLAKSELAKRCGVQTGDPLWLARQKCPSICFVRPHYEIYEAYSKRIREYYERYTPLVEPYGVDECWLDMSSILRGDRAAADKQAYHIKEEIKRIFGVTISVGISFNKVFAKLGSDMKKPDAVTHIYFEHFREQIWGLPVSTLLGVGRATSKKLCQTGIMTIGELAHSDRRFIHGLLGKCGDTLWNYANGLDDSPVVNVRAVRQSLGHGMTLPADVYSSVELWPVIERLSDCIANELQQEGFLGRGIQIYVRDCQLCYHEFQREISFAVNASRLIAEYSLMMVSQYYNWENGIHAFGIRLFHLERHESGRQLELFEEPLLKSRNTRESRVDQMIRAIQLRYGEKTLYRGGRD